MDPTQGEVIAVRDRKGALKRLPEADVARSHSGGLRDPLSPKGFTPRQALRAWTAGAEPMAVYHLSMKTVSRRQGRSAPAAAAYRSGAKLHDARQGLTFDYERREGVVDAEIRAPEAAPTWMRDRQALWDGAEAAERRRDALVARELEISLPRELTAEQQAELVRGYVDEQLVARGLVADVAIHERDASDGAENPHAHVLFKDRAVEGEGFAGRKDRGFNRPEHVERLREAWSEHANAALVAADTEARVDHRSLADQAAEAAERRAAAEAQADDPEHDPAVAEAEAAEMVLDREPEPKAGPAARALAQRGEDSERWGEVEQARQQRSHVQALAESMREAARQVRDAVTELAAKPRVPPASEVFAGTPVGRAIFGDERASQPTTRPQRQRGDPRVARAKELMQRHAQERQAARSDPEPEAYAGFTETPPEPDPWPRVELSEGARQEIEAVRSDEPIPEIEDEEPGTGPAPGM